MGLNIFKWIRDIATNQNKKQKIDLNIICQRLTSEIYIRELAFHMITNKIGNALSKCELNIYNEKKKDKR